MAEDELLHYFDYFDLDGSGELDPEEMKNLGKCLGISEGDIMKMMRDMDTNEDGLIQREEWLAYIKN